MKIKSKITATITTLVTTGIASSAAYAAPIQEQSADTVAEKVQDIISSYATPFGAVLIFGAVVAVALGLIINAHNAQKRIERMSALLWVGIGAGILGLASLIAGLFIGIN